jgi:hypothetical protein
MEETVICRLCLEPIYNFICINCLQKSVFQWLSKIDQKLANEIQAFHSSLLDKFSSDINHEFCVKCKNTVNTVICPYCYVKEIFWLIFDKNIKVSKSLAKLFDFDFLGTGYLPVTKVRNLNPVIITYKKPKSDFNICDSCGQISEDLKEVNGNWICETCRDIEKV